MYRNTSAPHSVSIFLAYCEKSQCRAVNIFLENALHFLHVCCLNKNSVSVEKRHMTVNITCVSEYSKTETSKSLSSLSQLAMIEARKGCTKLLWKVQS